MILCMIFMIVSKILMFLNGYKKIIKNEKNMLHFVLNGCNMNISTNNTPIFYKGGKHYDE